MYGKAQLAALHRSWARQLLCAQFQRAATIVGAAAAVVVVVVVVMRGTVAVVALAACLGRRMGVEQHDAAIAIVVVEL